MGWMWSGSMGDTTRRSNSQVFMVFSTLGVGMFYVGDFGPFFPLNTLEGFLYKSMGLQGMVADTFSPSSQEAEAAISLSLSPAWSTK